MTKPTHTLAAAMLAACTWTAAAQITWTGGGNPITWSNSLNWNPGVVPGATDYVLFDDSAGWVGAAGSVNNIVDTNALFAIAQLSYTARSGHFHTTLIPGGTELLVQGMGLGSILAVGDSMLLSGTTYTNYSSITGDGRLTVTNPDGSINIWQRSSSTVYGATLNLAGLASFAATVGNVMVGATPNSGFANSSYVSGNLILATNNTITTTPNPGAPGILLGRSEMGTTLNLNAGGSVVLGAVNTFNTDGLVVGGNRATASSLASQLNFAAGSTGGTFTLRGSAGGSMPAAFFNVADAAAREDGYAGTGLGTGVVRGTADFSGGAVDILADKIFVGRSANATGSDRGSAVGSLAVQQGTVSATNLYVGFYQGTAGSTYAQGTVSLNSNAVMNVSQDVVLGHGDSTNGFFSTLFTTGTLNVNDTASLNVGGNISNDRFDAVLNLGGGQVDMQPAGDATPGNVDLSDLAGFGVITNANAITVARTLTPGTTNSPGALYLDGNFAMAGGTINFNIGTGNGINADGNDYVRINGSTVAFNNPRLFPTFAGPLAPNTTYTLMQFPNATSVTGLVDAETPRYAPVSLTPTSLVMTVGASATGGLVIWQGGTSNLWNTSLLNTNWLYAGVPDAYRQYDQVVFDDSAVDGSVLLSAVVSPGSITFSNATKTIVVGNNQSAGATSITGDTGLLKEGAGVVLLTNNYNNTFTGPVTINAGTLQMGRANSGMFGMAVNSIAPFTVASGATFEFVFPTTSAMSVGTASSGVAVRPWVVGGYGVGGKGAITRSGSSANTVITVGSVTLTDNTLINTSNTTSSQTFTISGTNNAVPPASACTFDLAGNTLEKTGKQPLLLTRVTTTSGNILVSEGELRLTAAFIGDSGAVTLANGTLLSFAGASAETNTLTKKLNVVAGTAGLNAASASTPSVIFGGPVALAGSLMITNNAVFRLTNGVSGIGGIAKYGTSNLVFEANATYTGATEINAGRVVLAAGGSLASSNINVNVGGTFDVTAKGAGGYTLAAGQTLNLADANSVALGNFTIASGAAGMGSGTNRGHLTVNAGGSLIPGPLATVGTLTMASNLSITSASMTFNLGGTTNLGGAANDLVQCSALTLAGTSTITIVPVGSLITAPGTKYTLLKYTGTLTGGAANLNVISANPRFSFVASVDAAAKLVQVQASSVGGATLWRGLAVANPTAWDISTTTNWLFNGLPDVFFDGDTTVFSNSGLTNKVSLVGTLSPGSVIVSNNPTGHEFAGTGRLQAGALVIDTSSTGGATLANSSSNNFAGLGITLNPGTTLTLNQPVNTFLTGTLRGSGTLAKTGANVLTVVGDSAATFAGTNQVSAGTLRPGSVGALGGAPGTINVTSGGTLDVAGFRVDPATVNVAGTGIGAGAIVNSGGPVVMSNALVGMTLTGPTTLGGPGNYQIGRWSIDPAGTVVYNPAQGISDGSYFNAQNNSLTKVGTGDVRINITDETYLADINVGAGRLIFNNPSVTSNTTATLGNVANTITVSNGAALGLRGLQLGIVGQPTGTYARSGINAGTKPINLLSGSRLLALNGSSVLGGTITLATNTLIGATFETEPPYNSAGPILNFTGTIQGPGDLVVSNSNGFVYLSGTGSYGTNTVLKFGTLVLGNSGAIPANSLVSVTNNCSLWLANSPAMPASCALVMSSTSMAQNQEPYLFNSGSWAGPITLLGAGHHFGFVGGVSGNGLEILGPIDASGATGATIHFGRSSIGNNVNGSGGIGKIRLATPLSIVGTVVLEDQDFENQPVQLTLEAQNFWTNMVVNSRGIVLLRTNNALPPSAPITGVVPGLQSLYFDLGGYNQTLTQANIRLADGSANCIIGNGAPHTTSLLTFAGSGTSSLDAVIANNILGGGPDAIMSLTVTSGTLNLSNICTYTGPTLVTGGRLNLVGPLGQLGYTPVTVSGAGSLSGTGTIYGPVTNSAGGTLSPGLSVGTLTVNNTVTLEGDGTCWMEVNNDAGSNDVLLATSGITLGGTLVVTNIGSLPYANGQVIQLFSAGNTGSFHRIAMPGVVSYDASNLAAAGTIQVLGVVSTAPVSLTSTVSGGSLDLTWPPDHTGWRLETQTNSLSVGIANNWVTWPGSDQTNAVSVPIHPANPAVFLRLVYP
jgi:autotransporter-associated beta strand protein